MWGSNNTFLVQVQDDGGDLAAVYKPTRGERPLWDFPNASLARREVAAFWVSEALGWHLVPPTILRRQAPFGSGSLQLYIDHDVNYHYFNFSEADRQRLRPVVVFDHLINNADRKGSHVLIDPQNQIWLIDHGLCFHFEDKLRTVIWDFVGEAIPEFILFDLRQFKERLDEKLQDPAALRSRLRNYLSDGEVRALSNRAAHLIENGHFPAPDPQRRPFPWPQI